MPALAACWKVRLLSSSEGSAFTSAMVMMPPRSLHAPTVRCSSEDVCSMA